MSLISDPPLEYKKITMLLGGFAVPSITVTLVSSLYNIPDQSFMGQGVGALGNAAANASYPPCSHKRKPFGGSSPPKGFFSRPVLAPP